MRHLECNSSEAAPLTATSEDAKADEIAALRAQMRTLRAISLSSFALCVVALAILANNSLNMRGVGSHSSVSHLTHVADLAASTQLSADLGDNNVIVPYGFKSCDSTAMPPQIAPIRNNGDFLFLSGILGYDKPCKSAHKNATKQIEAAFKWADDTLKAAKVDWEDVLTVTSYHVELEKHQHIFSEMREKVLPGPPYPAWTAVGVKSLYFPDEIFEMTIVARKKECVGLECDR